MRQLSLTNQLLRLRRRLQFRLIGTDFAGALLTVSLGISCLGLYERCFPLREATAATLILALYFFSLILLAYLHCKKYSEIASASRLALHIENANPQLQDRFICAVELEEKAYHSSLNGMEQALLQETQQEFVGEKTLFPEVFRTFCPVRKILIFLACGMILHAFGVRTNAFQKGRHYFLEKLQDGPVGIRLQMRETDYALHSDVRIIGEITRWENQAEIEVQETGAGGAHYRFPMYPQGNQQHAFTIFDVTRELRFRILTPSLSTPWQKVNVFTPPAVDAVKMTTIPLPYTGHEARIFQNFESFELTAGEGFQLELSLPEGVSAQLQRETGETRLFPSNTVLQEIPEKTGKYSVQLSDKDGHTTRCPPFTVTVQPDLPPVLEIREPQGDCEVKLGDSLLLHVMAKDDFGLTSLTLQFGISGEKRQFLSLQTNELPNETEWEFRDFWNLEKLPLKDGDVISCVIVAKDNRIPDSQETASELFFITLRPDANEMEGTGPAMQNKKNADVSDLIEESKRLLRSTWELHTQQLFLTESESAQRHFELQRDIKELEVAVRRRLNDLRQEGTLPEALTALFTQSSQSLSEASLLLERNLPEESLPPQELSLSALVRIENELLKNAIRSQQAGQGDSGESQEQQEMQESQNPPPNRQQQAQQAMKTLKESLKELDSLLQRQQQINQDSARSSALASDLAKRQRQVRDDTARMEDRLRKLPEIPAAAQALRNATSEMTGGTDAFQRSDLQTGNLYGQRSHNLLVQARQELNATLRQSSAAQIQQLSDKADELSQAQANASQNSRDQMGKNNREASRALRETQKQLKSAAEQLETEIQQVSSALEEDYPKAAQTLRSAALQAQQRGLSKKQTRAGNALLYRQFESAAKEQQDAANLLQALSADLQSAREHLPQMNSEDLRQMLQQLEELANNADRAQRGRKGQELAQQIRNQAAQLLQAGADAFQDPRLQEITDELRNPASQIDSLPLFQAAGAVLQEHLSRLMLKDKVNFTRDTVTPPRKYKRQVEQYFKSLGQE